MSPRPNRRGLFCGFQKKDWIRGLTGPGGVLRVWSCKHELDSLGRPTQSQGHNTSGSTWKTALSGFWTLLKQLYMGLPRVGASGGKHPVAFGFDSRQSRHHYVIARGDLPRGVLAAQIIHAAGESSPGNLPTGTIAVALAARSESHLGFLEAKLQRLAIPHRAIREPDAPWNGALMAIGIHPVEDREPLKKVTSGLRLIK